VNAESDTAFHTGKSRRLCPCGRHCRNARRIAAILPTGRAPATPKSKNLPCGLPSPKPNGSDTGGLNVCLLFRHGAREEQIFFLPFHIHTSEILIAFTSEYDRKSTKDKYNRYLCNRSLNIVIMELSLDLNKRYTYADYLTWLDDKRRELVDGFIRMMSPAPVENHQRISSNLLVGLHQVIKKNKGKCRVYHAPFDVRLPKNGEKEDNLIYTVVQPDICIVCDLSKLDKRGCLGAPDLIAEIQSPSTAKFDLNEKFNLYESVGVREYWVVFPADEEILVFLLQPDGKYDKGTLYEEGKVPVNIFDGIEIDLKEIF
jgi:Uma2 family endonuclease